MRYGPEDDEEDKNSGVNASGGDHGDHGPHMDLTTYDRFDISEDEDERLTVTYRERYDEDGEPLDDGSEDTGVQYNITQRGSSSSDDED